VPRSFTEPGPDVPGLGSRARSGVCGCCRLIDKAWKIGGDAFESFVIHQIDGLDLEGLHKALGLGIVIGIATSDHFAGLDVSVKETSVCIVDDTGKIVREVKVPSEPEALLAALKNPVYHFRRIGFRATVTMALQRSRRSRVTCGLCRDTAHAGVAEGCARRELECAPRAGWFLQCAPRAGQFYAAVLTVCRA
jgi:hypothetical protein